MYMQLIPQSYCQGSTLMRSKHRRLSPTKSSDPGSGRVDIAIVGMACIFAGAPDVKTFWENILEKRCSISEPPDNWNAHIYFDPHSQANDRVYCKKGGYLKELATFNPLDYGIMPVSIDGSEPDQFLALRVAHEAVLDAGYTDRDFNRESTEVILGRGAFFNRGYLTLIQHGLVVDQTIQILKSLHPEHSEQELEEIRKKLKASLPPLTPETIPGLVPNIMCGRIMNRLDLMGASYSVDAACASSLIALNAGVEDLRAGKCDVAIVGGVQVSTPALIYMVFCQLNALSRGGQILPFDEQADGTLLGEGVGIIVLKRLDDAEQDGDRIYALVKGVGVASDGRALGLLAPRVEGEELALRRAYSHTDISPDTVGLIEAHGTATPVGDATEIEALTRVYGKQKAHGPNIALGSVKSMIGHIIPASGTASVIKTALALYFKVLPPTVCERPNPKFKFDEKPFYINTEVRPWINGAPNPRRAGINAFGFGGINAHAILEEYCGDKS
ncbi:MAG: beta-ketoacyl synthase N-terminal-like domain-containing protein [Chromatiales bacterium]